MVQHLPVAPHVDRLGVASEVHAAASGSALSGVGPARIMARSEADFAVLGCRRRTPELRSSAKSAIGSSAHAYGHTVGLVLGPDDRHSRRRIARRKWLTGLHFAHRACLRRGELRHHRLGQLLGQVDLVEEALAFVVMAA